MVTQSDFAHERAALAHVRSLLPDADPYQGWTTFSFITFPTGHVREVDLLVLTARRLFLVEIKSLRGRLTGKGGTWTSEGHSRVFDNPLVLTNQKCKELRARLNWAAKQLNRQVRIPFVQPVVFLSEPDLVCDLADHERKWVYGPDGPRAGDSTLPSIAEVFSADGGDSPDGSGPS